MEQYIRRCTSLPLITNRRLHLNALEIAHAIVDALEEKKAENIVLMDVSTAAQFTDYFIICSGTSDRMLKSLGDFILEEVRNKFKIHGKMEGKAENGWVLIDLDDIVIHFFFADQRKYYALEDLWQSGKILLTIQ